MQSRRHGAADAAGCAGNKRPLAFQFKTLVASLFHSEKFQCALTQGQAVESLKIIGLANRQ